MLFIIFASALSLRLYKLYEYDLWFDELISNGFSASNIQNAALYTKINSPIVNLFKKISNDPHPSCYYTLVYIYSILFGEGKSLRILSVVFSLLSLGLFYKFARLFFDRQISIYALLIMTFSPFHIWHAQEARGFTMACFFVLGMVYMYIQALKTNKLSLWIYFVIFSIFSMYCSCYAGILLLCLWALFFLEKNRYCVKKIVLSYAFIMIGSLPLIFIVIKHMLFIKHSFWLSFPTIKSVLSTFAVFNLGYSAFLSEHLACLSLSFALFVYGFYGCYQNNRNNAIALLLLIFLPIGIVYFISKIFAPIYIERHFIILTPFYYLFIARGIGGIRNRILKTMVGTIIGLLLLSTLMNYYQNIMLTIHEVPDYVRIVEDGDDLYQGIHHKKKYASVLNRLQDKFNDNDIIIIAQIHTVVLSEHYTKWYYKNMKTYFLLYPKALYDFSIKQLENFTGIQSIREKADDEQALYYIYRQNGVVYLRKGSPITEQTERVWFVYTYWCLNTYWNLNIPMEDNVSMIKKNVLNGLTRTLTDFGDGVYVELYEKSVT